MASELVCPFEAIANLSVYATVAKVVEEGGINILAGLARSMNRLVAEEGAKGLRNLSVGEQHKGAIVEAGGVKALVDLLFKWSTGGEEVLERAAAALANLAADAKCSTEVAVAGGVHALVMLARNCKFDGVQEQAARALTNLAAHGDSNINNAATGQEAGALEASVQLKRSPNKGVRQEAAGALWNLSFDDRYREAIAAVGGVEALERGFKAKEVVNSTSALSPSGPDPTHDNSNMSNTNLANSTLYNSYGALNPSGADPYYDYINRSDTKGANSGNPLRQLQLIL
ncbi:protein ARABIDILLO 1-like isoform X2 [Quercus lobata]|nr:protein ARABIDILLO 1-like isoform X2 [Quercus lobata]